MIVEIKGLPLGILNVCQSLALIESKLMSAAIEMLGESQYNFFLTPFFNERTWGEGVKLEIRVQQDHPRLKEFVAVAESEMITFLQHVRTAYPRFPLAGDLFSSNVIIVRRTPAANTP